MSKVTKKMLENIENGVKAIKNTNRDVYISMGTGEKYIEYMVEKGNFYYCGSDDDDCYVYWDNNSYGFTFSKDIFKKTQDEENN